MSERNEVVSASAWMALGTIVSRLTGFGRALLLIAAIGTSLNADVFNNANSIPTALYILVAGGIFNVVLVPQLVRAMRYDEDGGDAYANRVITLGIVVLGTATIILIAIVPLLMRVVFASSFFAPELQPARESAYLLMVVCMPQVFFYGVFVLVGQILNARKWFGPMMWAPILNNVVAGTVLVAFLAIYGSTNGTGGFTVNQGLILGLGSTLGIALQAAVLIPYLRKAGFHYRPRFDFRGVGLGHTLRLGAWTFLFIVANQIAFIVILKIGTRATTEAALEGGRGAGSAVYEFGFLISQVPHGIITVSLATAIMPTLSALAAEKQWPAVQDEISRTLRIALAVIAPIAVAVACLGQSAATVTTSYGKMSGNTELIGHTIMAFAPAMIFFPVQYLMLRGFYAAENTRTPFFIQVVIAATNIGFAVFLTSLVGTELVSTMLALSYGAAYLIGSTLSVLLLSRIIGPVFDRRVAIFLPKLVVACACAAATMLAVIWGLDSQNVGTGSVKGAFITLVTAGPVGAVTYLIAARLVGLREIGSVIDTVIRRRRSA